MRFLPIWALLNTVGRSEVPFEWEGTLEKGNSLQDMTSKVITARYRSDQLADSHYLALRTYRDKLSQHIRHRGFLEECRDLMDIWQQSAADTSTGTFVDVGANIGACSIYFAAKGINTLAFEPLPSNLYYFTKAVILNRVRGKQALKNLRLFKVALDSNEVPKMIQMNVQRDNAGNAMVGRESFVVDTDNRLPTHEQGMYYNISVPVASFDMLLPKIFSRDKEYIGKRGIRVHLLKLDCQGAETNVLKGMKHLLHRDETRPNYIYTEVDPLRLHAMGSSARELCNLLGNDYGYVMNDPQGETFDTLVKELEEVSTKKGTLAATNILVRVPAAPQIQFSID